MNEKNAERRAVPEGAGAGPDDAVLGAVAAELKRLPLAQRIAVRALWRGIPVEEAAVLLVASPAEVRRLADLGLDELRRSLARRGLFWNPQSGAVPAELLGDDDEVTPEATSGSWLADLEAVGTAPEVEGPEAFPVRVWSSALVIGAFALFLLGGGFGNVRPTFSGPAAEIEVLPLLVSPEGPQPSPPLHFHWEPSGPDVDFAQVILYRQSFERIWESAPTTGDEVTVPPQAYDGVWAGETCYWRVREVADGKPRGSSPFVSFEFAVDNKGYGPGEAPPPELLLE